ncbi:hypothetical protein [Nonomuraea longicatena]|uniref:Uncharacterized protein n=1 Tax=Nonomuraea longicatena TaxID=83682 RepID=A0ABP3Z4I9_9ACTN
MRWDSPQPFLIKGWIVMDGAGGGFIALRVATQADTANVVCAADADALRRGVARVNGITTLRPVTCRLSRLEPAAPAKLG